MPLCDRVYEALTMRKRVGCGNIFIIINEIEGAFYNIIIKGDNAKSSPCGESWQNAMAAVLTYALRQSIWEGTTQRAIVKHLKNHRCSIIIPNQEHIVSCVDAIGKCVLEYLKARGLDEEEKEKDSKEETTNTDIA